LQQPHGPAADIDSDGTSSTIGQDSKHSSGDLLNLQLCFYGDGIVNPAGATLVNAPGEASPVTGLTVTEVNLRAAPAPAVSQMTDWLDCVVLP
jgi:hypothetical protein